jgi:hypothetical protein
VEIIKKFADDTKVGQTVTDQEGREKLQAALDGLCDWSQKWGMEFNIPKCKVMHLGAKNPKNEYSMNGSKLLSTTEEKDIGVTVTDKLKPSAQCAKAAKTAQTVLGQISRAFHYRDRHVFVRLYKQYVRPHLEFATQAWSPWTVTDCEVLERVQRRAVRMVSGLKGVSHEEKLKELGLQSLAERRHQADMHMVHRIMHGDSGLRATTWFGPQQTASQNTRSVTDQFHIRHGTGRLEIRRNFFSVRVISEWNSIPQDLRKHPRKECFKRRYKLLREGPTALA